MTLRAVASIHDVAPSTLDRVQAILDLLAGTGSGPATLLVVPGRDWGADDLDRLARWRKEGHRLAGHGWSHRAPPPATLRHRLHGALISRDQAEHLSRSRPEVRRIVRHCHEWFGESGLDAPDLYVPPAWALGPLTATDLRDLPFRLYETLTGLVRAETGRRTLLPLVGFEADTRTRVLILRVTNAANLALARIWKRPVRIAFHPDDLELGLAGRIGALMRRPWSWIDEEAALT